MKLEKQKSWFEDKRRQNLEETVAQIRPVIHEVRDEGVSAVRKYTEKFDGVEIEDFEVEDNEKEEAIDSLSEEEKMSIRNSIERIEDFHRGQKPEGWSRDFEAGFTAGEKAVPVDAAGCYVPGGRYPLPSSALMTVIPAKIAGVEQVVVCTPPDENGDVNPYTVAAAEMAGADRIYKIGGAQALAALAYGAGDVPEVEKIVGPGNRYVTAAKKILYGDVGIDFLAGPSEVLIVSDGSNPELVAADMLAQAEHDTDSSAVLVTMEEDEVGRVEDELESQLEDLPTSNTAREALEQNGAIFLAEDRQEAMEIANRHSPEHLELMLEDPEDAVDKVRNAGTVFVGSRSVEALGDYTTGTNHVLPTGGAARYRGGLSVRDFVKMIAWERQTPESLKQIGQDATNMAEIESLPAHRRSVEKRMGGTR
ncbi:MAG: histidinol dehydrogenase [Candidatus Nanohaloarchaea archaeon]